MQLSIGKLNRDKNHTVVIKAMRNLNQNIDYLIVGKGYLVDKLERAAENLNVKDRIYLLEYRLDIADFLEIADIYSSIHTGRT